MKCRIYLSVQHMSLSRKPNHEATVRLLGHLDQFLKVAFSSDASIYAHDQTSYTAIPYFQILLSQMNRVKNVPDFYFKSLVNDEEFKIYIQ